jgi:hypothetical protein
MLKPMFENALSTRMNIIARSEYANIDPTTITQEQLTLDLTNRIKQELRSEVFSSFDSTDPQGKSINASIINELSAKAMDLAKPWAENIYKARVTNPELIKTLQSQEQLFETSAKFGPEAISGTDYYKDVQQQVIREERGALSGLMTANIGDLETTLLANVYAGKKIKTGAQFMLWKLYNAQGMKEIERAEAKLRITNPASDEFKYNVQVVLNQAKAYMEGVSEDGKMMSPETAYTAVETLLRNPRLEDYIQNQLTPGEGSILLDILNELSTKTANEIKEKDKIYKWDRFNKVNEAMKAMASGSFGGGLFQQEEKEKIQEFEGD